MTRRPVFVKSVGAVTPLGETWRSTAEALARGERAIRPITPFDATGFPCTVAAWLPRTQGDGVPGSTRDPENRAPGLAARAAREAWSAAEVSVQPERIGIFAGAEAARPSFTTVIALAQAAGDGERLDPARFGRRAAALLAPGDPLSPAAVTSRLAREVGARGPSATLSLACASSAAAVAEAFRAIQLGVCDVALCGGVGADVDPLMLAGFGLLGALSEKGRSCPFDVRRDGFVLGEAAAMLVLTSDRTGALAELRGAGRTLDAHHLTAPEPSGDGALRAMRLALEESGLDRVDYVQAHGTSTPKNDAVEAAALRRLLGRGLAHAHVGSVKGALGHTIAAAGALGLLCAIEAVSRGILLPTAGLTHPDPECDLPHVTHRAISRCVDSALANAFAFGGANCSLVVSRA